MPSILPSILTSIPTSRSQHPHPFSRALSRIYARKTVSSGVVGVVLGILSVALLVSWGVSANQQKQDNIQNKIQNKIQLAQQVQQKIMVMNFLGTGAPDVLTYLTEKAREAVTDNLASTMEVFDPSVIPSEKASKCVSDSSCDLEIFNALGADFGIAGEYRSIAGSKSLTLKVYNVQQQKILAQQEIKGKTDDEVIAAIYDGAVQVLLKGKLIQTAKKKTATPIVGTEGEINGTGVSIAPDVFSSIIVSFESNPVGASVEVDDDVICDATPCTKKLASGAHVIKMRKAKYATGEQTVNISKQNKNVSMRLQAKFGVVSVTTNPSGMPVYIDGEKKGTSPLRLELDAGQYEITTEDGCYVKTGQRIVLQANDTREIALSPKPIETRLQVDFRDSKNNDLEATIVVDGKRLGLNDQSYVVPVCSKELVVEGAKGKASQKLALKVGVVNGVVLKVGLEERQKLEDKNLTSQGKTCRVLDNDIAECDYNAGKLQWQRRDDGKTRAWRRAQEYCAGLSLGGYEDWRLPSVWELVSLFIREDTLLMVRTDGSRDWNVRDQRNKQVELSWIDLSVFPNGDAWYWSNTPVSGDAGRAWGVNFGAGFDGNNDMGNLDHVRCVR